MGQSTAPAGIRLGVVRGISYGMFGAPDSFVLETRGLGATLVRVFLYWGQVEPEPGRYDWSAVDAVLGQLDQATELWITVCSSSPWATRQPAGFLPSSPALDPAGYERFVGDLVARCGGRVDYWQCGNEPSNTGLLWAGTAPEYVAQLTAFHRAVRAADPAAAVVLGGCGFDVLSGPADSEARRFFDHVVEHGREAYDLFDVHLYGDPHAIPDQVAQVRAMMRRHGDERPVVAGEYNGPTLFEFPRAQAELERAMTAAFTGAAEPGETPDRATMRLLYEHAPELPPELRMFMEDCAPELAARRDRVNCRQIVTRTLLALACGLTRTACWNLAPEIPGYRDRLNLMGFLFGRLALMDYEGTAPTRRRPSADAFALLTAYLDGVTDVRRLTTEDHPGLYAFEVAREGRGPLRVLWRSGDPFTGEDDPAILVDLPWPHAAAHAADVFGADVPLRRAAGTVGVPLSVTPVFLSTEPREA